MFAPHPETYMLPQTSIKKAEGEMSISPVPLPNMVE